MHAETDDPGAAEKASFEKARGEKAVNTNRPVKQNGTKRQGVMKPPGLQDGAYLGCKEVREGFVVQHDTEYPEMIDRGHDTRELIENTENQCNRACGNGVQPEVIQ